MKTDQWPQYLITFTDRTSAEHAGTTIIAPALQAVAVDEWWFLRKTPAWRIRIAPQTTDAALSAVEALLTDATAAGHAVHWRRGIYEPETLAFGGPEGTGIAHRLAHNDSIHTLAYLGTGTPLADLRADIGRREIAIVLAATLLRAAGLDWYEQGDVWSKIAEHRPLEGPPAVVHRHRETVYRLLTADITRLATADQPLAAAADWLTAFRSTGQALAGLNTDGQLKRGLRAVLTHHILFAWNRLGLPLADQHTLSRLATTAVMHDDTDIEPTPVIGVSTTTLTEVKPPMSPTSTTTSDEATRLRDALVQQLVTNGAVHTPAVEAALRATPRHLFVPDASLEQAYADDAVYTKHDATGASISAASQPTVVATMLEQLQAQPGQSILELGAGTGYNAALLATLVGEFGHITTIDVDQDIVDGARRGLAAAGHNNVEVLLGDGAKGHPSRAPYDQIIATVGAWDLPAAWTQQLAPTGRLVVPLRLRGSVSRSIVFERDGDTLRSTSSQMSTFMPLRDGIADDPRRFAPLTTDRSVELQLNQEQTIDTHQLVGIFDSPSHEAWSGVAMAGSESFEWLDLWLTCTLPGALSRMPTAAEARESELVRPQFGWGAMATADCGNLAYLTLRPVTVDGSSRFEIGVIGHGAGAKQLIAQVTDQIQKWDQHYRGHDVDFAVAPNGDAELTGQFVFTEPNNQLAITWQ